ncbi:hypothetical protein A8144_11565 [Mycobacterium leprae 3125609]|nr:hypothetical protein A8144_11565 [Mycobacterium leprae 3125609]OAX70604.1 hypothetical protein A3216_10950 [Mycobacterium leprae 7935681]
MSKRHGVERDPVECGGRKEDREPDMAVHILIAAVGPLAGAATQVAMKPSAPHIIPTAPLAAISATSITSRAVSTRAIT